ncbi:cobalt ABC transporter ATP-binding protein [Aeromicrobium sp. A1-2]|uniref:ABC transporter ATP-binding protein n=1 Tax=Aeromicrobium sp. A1-2 TaxID=2107713 RepID=UPI000E52E150|nr:ABC transporter ATP-binding protein [Aeromicrobium sp. A1-2]AXT83789.1 cobalt ABC transporter ATP-binding protein [Aeromicrobium sp. A1-2]
MIELRGVSFQYDGASRPVLRGVDLTLPEAELVLVAGRTGSGKSTLLGMFNGLVPHFSGGTLEGHVLVDGEDIRRRPPRELADVIGYVGQDPLAGFVSDIVEDELAYGMEQLGLDARTMRRRVEETLDLLGIAALRSRPLRTLSGGQQQRVAIGAVLTMHPRVLVLDEPTSALDPTAAEEVLATLARLVDDLGLTVVLAEHRLERVIPFADRLVLVEGGRVRDGAPVDLLVDSEVAPPLIELGRLAGWTPLPLSVREARRARGSLGELTLDPTPLPDADEPALSATGISVAYGTTIAVKEVDIVVPAGRVVALMGRNGSGKSSLLWALQGTGRRRAGTVDVDGSDPAKLSSDDARALVGLVPQTASDLLYLESVDEECAAADAQTSVESGSCRGILDRLAPGVHGASHPRDLSEGQRLALVLSIVLTAEPRVIALDEPTRGLDYTAKRELSQILRDLAAKGHGVLLATHDVEFVAQVVDSCVVLAEGEVVSSGPTARVLAESPAFAPQMSKILGPGWLTVDQVAEAMA